MTKISILPILLICSTASIFCSQPNQQSCTIIDILDQKIQQKDLKKEQEQIIARRKEEYRLMKLEEAKQAHQKTIDACIEAAKKNKEAFLDTIIWANRSKICEECAILANSKFLPYLALSCPLSAVLLANIDYNPKEPSFAFAANVVPPIFSILFTTACWVGLYGECQEAHEYTKKQLVFPNILTTSAPDPKHNKMV